MIYPKIVLILKICISISARKSGRAPGHSEDGSSCISQTQNNVEVVAAKTTYQLQKANLS